MSPPWARLPALCLALTYGIGAARWVGRAVAPAGGGAAGLARFIFGVGGFVFGGILFYCTVLGSADLLVFDSGMAMGTRLWIALGIVAVVQITAQIWAGEDARKQD